MNHEKILWKILETFQKCNVKSFPINCYDLLEQHGYEVLEYSELEDVKQAACYQVSNDAFRLNHTVYYNDSVKFCRRRFTLMHELGHIVLNHKAPYTNRHEYEANFFASNILAPRMAIHYSKCKNANDVAKIFELTYEAASYAFDDYRRWRRTTIHRMSIYDKAMYGYFYNQDQKCFVWKIQRCQNCRMKMYNTLEEYCSSCKVYRKPEPDIIPLHCIYPLEYMRPDRDFLIAEGRYLYGHEL